MIGNHSGDVNFDDSLIVTLENVKSKETVDFKGRLSDLLYGQGDHVLHM